MKSLSSLCRALCLWVFFWLAMPAQEPTGLVSPSAGGSDDLNDNPFEDPFASATQPATAPPKIKDPLQPMNRAFFHFNDKLYLWVVEPAGKGYSKVVPRPARRCVGRFFGNVKYPVHLVNNLLQGKFKAAGIETGRFVVNSTVGVGGLFDPATRWRIEAHPATFDQTLGSYGLGPGIYFNWPVFGPSSPRGTAGLVADGMLSPWFYIGGVGVVYGVPAYRELNSASLNPGAYESFKKATLDPYVAVRSAYYERRADAGEKSRAKGVANPGVEIAGRASGLDRWAPAARERMRCQVCAGGGDQTAGHGAPHLVHLARCRRDTNRGFRGQESAEAHAADRHSQQTGRRTTARQVLSRAD